MAVKSVRVRTCDHCGRDEGNVERWVITGPDGRRSVDLHAEHVDELTLGHIVKVAGPPRRGKNLVGQPVVTEAEIEAAKKTAARKRAAKKGAAKRTARKRAD